jgi:hypothetical protein
MRILRWIVTRLLAAFLWLVLVILATVTIILATANPSFIKTTLAKSGLYKTVVASSLKLASTSIHDNSQTDLNNLISGLTPSAQQVLTPQLLETDVNKVIDGFDNWLNGQTAVPQFSIDTAVIKNNLNTALAVYLQQRVTALPACPANNKVPSYDLLTTDCLPPVQLSQTDFANAANNFTQNIPALDKAQLSSTEIIKNNDDTVWQKVPHYYHLARLVPYILGVVAVALIGLIVLISSERIRALRRVGHILLSNGVILLISGAITVFYVGRNNFDFIANGSTVEQANFVKETAVPLIHHLANSLGSWLLYFGVGYALLGAVFYFLAHFFKLRHNKRLKTAVEPVAAIESAPEPAAEPKDDQLFSAVNRFPSANAYKKADAIAGIDATRREDAEAAKIGASKTATESVKLPNQTPLKPKPPLVQ